VPSTWAKYWAFLLGELVEGPEEAQIDRALATPLKEPLQGGSVVGLHKPKRDIVSAGYAKRHFVLMLLILWLARHDEPAVPPRDVTHTSFLPVVNPLDVKSRIPRKNCLYSRTAEKRSSRKLEA
jgi:hypothetical protein